VLTIGEVESKTGLSKDTLRKWESRYGFPLPQRNELGIRFYTPAEVQKIQTIKFLLNRGEKISRLSRLSLNQLLFLLDSQNCSSDRWRPQFSSIFEFSKNGDYASIRSALLVALDDLGLQRFVLEFIAPFLIEIGLAWHNGEISIAQEHLCTAQIMQVLSEENAKISNSSSSIKVLLATPPSELHTIGLKMVETMILLAGGSPINLGAQTPVDQIIQMANHADVKVVAISVSAAYPLREFRRFIETLDCELPRKIDIWVGGSGAREIKSGSRVKCFRLEEIALNLSDLKSID
jgi:methylmalonyl-CoA mutase cobalamin-binding subunit